MSNVKKVLIGLGLTAVSMVVVLFVARRLPDNMRALFQA
jgi:hypothetical protein